ncbi:MAG: ABC transporter ATP-binding protein [Lewinellaceae bacterium]|nr:ABC transporter ATP-binding protein [Saprospiraceae bacterium]MCB9340273.1 ABC transporter ATP-binding protein [Lewinellaceae bacterium]
MPSSLLQINDLIVTFPLEAGTLEAVKGISFSLQKGETLGIVGESGSGKSVTALSIMGLLPGRGKLANGEIIFQPKEGGPLDLAKLTQKEFRPLRGKEIGMIFQEPMTSLNPVFRCGEQVAEAIRLHQNASPEAAKKQVLSLFEKVKLPDPERMYRSYPHQLSGGQRQRVVIAMALSCNPSLLIADEPTSALDVTVQRSILDLVNDLKNDWDGSTIFITHDLGVVAEVADRVLVMEKGQIVEQGRVGDILKNPQHPYTQKLLENFKQRTSKKRAPKLGSDLAHLSNLESRLPVLSVKNLFTWFPSRRSFFGKTIEYVKAVDGVSLDVFKGETLGLVGESGSGKTTLGRSILHLLPPTSGDVSFKKQNLSQVADKRWKGLRKNMQIIFQDPYSSLDPRQTIGAAIVEPMQVHGILTTEKERREKALELLETVGLDASHFWRFPNEFSGGQRQRICIARALALEPEFIICDECVSSLDVTVQAQVLDLLKNLQEKHSLTYIFISHDLAVVRLMSDRIAVMKDGKIVEMGEAEEVYTQPKSDYTKSLLSAVLGIH